MSLTPAQLQAIEARGNVLVVAGAGTGKTHTLVERCLSCVLDEQSLTSLEEILMVTFTEAAAAEMRQRIRDRLEAKLHELEQQPQRAHAKLKAHLREQLAIFETAHIGTLHSFCLQLIRQHFYQLELDPQLSVLPEEEASLLAQETLDELLQKHYTERNQKSAAVRALIQSQGRRGDEIVRGLILRLHHYTQARADPEGWFQKQITSFSADAPTQWREWLSRGMIEWRERWQPLLEREAIGNDVAARCARALKNFENQPVDQQAAAFQEIAAACENCPHGRTRDWLEPLKKFFAEAEFLEALLPDEKSKDPLAEDWEWARKPILTLLELAQEFAELFAQSKRELGVVDFSDLEQYALRLLWDLAANAPTKTGLEWRRRLRFVFVDEYQDINSAQDKIITALSRDAAQANRFLVGDVKQSIYRFRQADPSIFRSYLKAWDTGSGHAIPLIENFRSREAILNFANSFFSLVMREELGGIAYDERTKLCFGAPEERAELSLAVDSSPRVELLLRLKGKANQENGEDEAAQAAPEHESILELRESEKEARLVALHLRDLKLQGHRIFDKAIRKSRPVLWSDMAVLLRSPSTKAESYAKEFSALNIPLHVHRGGFYTSLEVSDLVNLLRLLDNPLQDLPLLAVLHSPLVGLTTNELATIRLAAKGHFWTTLRRWHEIHAGNNNSDATTQALLRKVSQFLSRHSKWRRLARQASLSRCLDVVLRETHYSAWLLTQPRGEERQANVQRLLALALQFDQFQRQSLFRFLCFVEAQELAEAEPEVAATPSENAVRLMSIHQSKGLEFPVVVLADIGKSFNLADLRGDIILDEEFGLCPQIRPEKTGKRYPSLPYWLAAQRQKRELLGEELRLLYVAMTRARDTLILSGAVTKSKFEKAWVQNDSPDSSVLSSANSYADWLALWFSKNCTAATQPSNQGQNSLLRWTIHEQVPATKPEPLPSEELEQNALTLGDRAGNELFQRLSWQYPFLSATSYPAKTSVTILRRRAAEQLDDAAAEFSFRNRRVRRIRDPAQDEPKKPKAEVLGQAHHTFLQHVSLAHTGAIEELREQARAMQDSGVLSADETKLLDFEALAAFWQSDLGQKIRADEPHVRRELAFTARFSPNEIAAITGELADTAVEHEFVVIQGVVDIAVLLPKQIWLLDFKTDRVDPKDLPAKARLYQPQLKLYAAALTRIYRRPVSNAWLYFLSQRAAVHVSLSTP